MKFFLDTEFIESGPGKPVQLVSIGIKAEDGREYYAISSEFNPLDANPWVQENVLARLERAEDVPGKTLNRIAADIRAFVGNGKPEFWGCYADYDWVVFCQIFGTMMDLPEGFPMYCRDIRQLCDALGSPDLPKQDSVEHNALNDARWNERAYQFLSAAALES